MEITKTYDHNGRYVGYYKKSQYKEMNEWLKEGFDVRGETIQVKYNPKANRLFKNKSIPEKNKIMNSCNRSDLLYLLYYSDIAVIKNGKVDRKATELYGEQLEEGDYESDEDIS